ncbi:hypothetical protein CN055_08200 [Campylobacter coli]|nr:hypothetical protein [Campylobacter coli]EAK4337644.1 hypothetical protein [Campylobacter coli]
MPLNHLLFISLHIPYLIFNAFKYRYNSALIRFLIFPPVGQIFPPVGKKLLVVGKLLSYVKVLIYL